MTTRTATITAQNLGSSTVHYASNARGFIVAACNGRSMMNYPTTGAEVTCSRCKAGVTRGAIVLDPSLAPEPEVEPDAECVGCSATVAPLEVFPAPAGQVGVRCLTCYAASADGRRTVTADELARMWGGA